MTEKRFTMGGTNNNIWIKDNCEDNRYNKYLLKNLNEVAYVCMMLNELYEENRELKRIINGVDENHIIRINKNDNSIELIEK